MLRDKLIGDVIKHFVEGKIFMHDADFESVSSDIVAKFQHERKVNNIYVVKSQKINNI